MADSGNVTIPPVEVSVRPEIESDVAVLCGSSADGLKQSSGNREDHEKVSMRSLKRRRTSIDVNVSSTEKEDLINKFSKEIDELFRYFNQVLAWKLGSEDEKCCSINSAMACMLEGSNLSFSRLANEIYEKLKAKDMVTLASVQRDVHFIGSRLSYGMGNGNKDFFEDESESCLWCWEVRDYKLLPKSKRKISKAFRKGREKVRERIGALSEILSVLVMPETEGDYKANFLKALERLCKTLNLEEICSLVQKLMQKTEDEIAKMETKSKEKELLKETETNKRNLEKEMKKHERELQKEKSQNERELKRRQVEAEKEERRREKEEAEAKKQLSLKKQASLMERFLKSKKSNNVESELDKLPEHVQPSDCVGKNLDLMGSSTTTASMDMALCQQDSMGTEDIWKSYVAAWHKMRRSNKSQHWGIRHKPKAKVINELKLQGSPYNVEEDINESGHNNDCIARNSALFPRSATKLLQFDKSNRPAYYGSWSKKSVVVGPRHPFAKDKDLDYDFDSDEEWEEEEPGESLSDCDKDDAEDISEGGLREDDEDESEDSFFVPDGYLSETEGVQVESTRTDDMSDDARSSPRCMPEVDNEELFALLGQQKYLDTLTQQALRKNQPLIITNLLYEKSGIKSGKDLNGTSKIEQICFSMLCMVACPGGPIVEEPFDIQASEDPALCQTQNKNNTPVAAAAAATMSDPNLSEYVHCIQSNHGGMAKVIESLHQKFPSTSKMQLRNKVREISEFVNNRWEVKKEVLDKLGISVSPDKGGRLKGIATFFTSKRCLPPTGDVIKMSESLPETCPKADASVSEGSHHAIRDNSL